MVAFLRLMEKLFILMAQHLESFTDSKHGYKFTVWHVLFDFFNSIDPSYTAEEEVHEGRLMLRLSTTGPSD